MMDTDVNAYIKRVFKDAKTRASRRGAPFTATLDDWIDIYSSQEGTCHATGFPLVFTATPMQRTAHAQNIMPILINQDEGYTKENIRFVCARVGAMKSDMSYDALVRWCGDIAAWDKYKSNA